MSSLAGSLFSSARPMPLVLYGRCVGPAPWFGRLELVGGENGAGGCFCYARTGALRPPSLAARLVLFARWCSDPFALLLLKYAAAASALGFPCPFISSAPILVSRKDPRLWYFGNPESGSPFLIASQSAIDV